MPSPEIVQKRLMMINVVMAEDRNEPKISETPKAREAIQEMGAESPKNSIAIMNTGIQRMIVGTVRIAKALAYQRQ